MPDPPVTGWYLDPYQRHEVRWMSEGAPTPLVRDGSIESNDPVGDAPAAAEPKRVVVEVAQHQGGLLGWLLLALGLIAIVGGGYLLLQQSSSISSHHFNPPPSAVSGPSAVQTGNPTVCGGRSQQVSALTIGPNNADTEFTVPPGDVVVVENHARSLPTLSSNASVCLLDSDVIRGETLVSYELAQSGPTTVFIADGSGRTAVVKIDAVTSSSSSTQIAGWVLLAIGVLTGVSGCIVVMRRGRVSPSDLHRAGGDPKNAPYDAQRAQRAAWDAFDQSAGQF